MAVAFAVTPTAQCTPQLVSGGGYPGANSVVRACTEWDPDGAGPAPSLLVIAGIFSSAGTATSNRIAAVDPATGVWSSLGSGFAIAAPNSADIKALAVLPNGHLVAAGFFSSAGGVAANNIAEWDGTSWAPLGAGLNGGAYVPRVQLAVLPTGDLVAAGSFGSAGGVAVNNIARWDGSTWHAMGSGTSSDVLDLAVAPGGDLIVAGLFQAAGGLAAPGLARWNGAWSSVPIAGVSNPRCTAVEVQANGDLVAAVIGGTLDIRRWNGATWTTLGAAAGVSVLSRMPNGDLLAGGNFNSVGGVAAAGVARWNGTSWSPLAAGIGGSSTSYAYAITPLSFGGLAVGGQFLTAGGIGTENIARWDGTQWRGFGGGANNEVLAVSALPDGRLLAGGMFTNIGSVPAGGVGLWSGGGWNALGTGVSGTQFSPGPAVRAFTTMQNGDIVIGGHFLQAGGSTANHVARWNGSAWSSLGSGVSSISVASVQALATLPNGDVVAGGRFDTAGGVPANGVARWDGVAWSPIGTGFVNEVMAIVVMPNGDPVVGGNINGGVRRWNGTSWGSIGTGVATQGGQGDWVAALAVMPNGDLVIGGVFSSVGGVSANHIARWDGAAWWPLGSGLADEVTSIVALADGDIIACATVPSGTSNAWRWDGTSWTPFAQFFRPSTHCRVAATAKPDGDVVFGGAFVTANSQPANRIASLVPTCRASATVVGSGCMGPGGMLQLTASVLPWLGASASSQCTGLGAGSFALAVVGFAPSAIPLAQLHPTAGIGCTLLASPDAVWLLPTQNGTADLQLAIPVAPALVGAVLYEQAIELDLDAQLQVAGLFAANALRIVLGAL